MYNSNEIIALQKATTKISELNEIEDVNLLREVLRFHEHRYYVLNDPLISDEEYDHIYKKLENFEKTHPESITADSPTQRVGNSLNIEFKTVNHLVPMLSLENSYNPDDLIAWDKRLKGIVDSAVVEYSVEPKFDGASLSLLYENNFLERGVTRGNGFEGDDVTLNIRQVGSIPLSAEFKNYGIEKIEIRGEVMMNKSSFKDFNEALISEGLAPLANPRNAAAGSLRMKDPTAVRKRKLEAIFYHASYIEAGAGDSTNSFIPSTHSGRLQLLNQLGFKTPIKEVKIFSSINEVISYCLEFEVLRDNLPYEIDGMVIKVNKIELQQKAGSTSHHPRWAMAYKFKARQATSKLLTIEYQVGRTGAVTPVAKIEPVRIGGVTVSSVSLFNENIITEKDIRVGDTVIVERAGDVIPYIVKPLTELRTGHETKIIFPAKCPVCHAELVKPEGEAVWRCENIGCEAQVVERIIHFVSKDAMDIRSMGEANVRKFYSEGIISNIPSIYELDFTQLGTLAGFGQKSIDNLKSAIEKSKDQPLHRLIFGLGIRYVGETTAKALAKSIDSIFELGQLTTDQLSTIKDIGAKVSESIFDFFHNEENLETIKKLDTLGLNTIGEKKEDKDGILSGSTFLFTGTLPGLKRAEAEALAEKHGGKILSAVSANLTYLVAGESAGSKLEKAKKIKSIQIINEAEFLNLINS
ncbi:MAG: NAD-dependent DNA ligase LigA [Bacteroidetes bacterium]|nr:NAD-dependent DNA ligase LigA [Bacteroidota bacterium]